MPEIVVCFNRTTNEFYKSYAKLVYSVSYADNVSNRQSTATINVDFYIKPDSYTYTSGAGESLYLGIRKGTSTATMIQNTISPTLTYGEVESNVYNHVGSTSFTVEYDSLQAYSVYLAAGYNNNLSERFAPFYMPQSDGSTYELYTYENDNTNKIVLEKRFNYTACTAPTGVYVDPSPMVKGYTELHWTKSNSGVANTVTNYEVQCCRSSDRVNWQGWEACRLIPGVYDLCNLTVSVQDTQQGEYIKYRIRAQGSAGEEFYSSWTESGIVQRNTPPTKIAEVSLDKSTYSSGEGVTITWTPSIDAEGGVINYAIYFSRDNRAWDQLDTTYGTSYESALSAPHDGSTIQFRITPYDSEGEYAEPTYSPVLTCVLNTNTLKVCVNGVYKEAEVYACVSGVYKKSEAYVCNNGIYKKGET